MFGYASIINLLMPKVLQPPSTRKNCYRAIQRGILWDLNDHSPSLIQVPILPVMEKESPWGLAKVVKTWGGLWEVSGSSSNWDKLIEKKNSTGQSEYVIKRVSMIKRICIKEYSMTFFHKVQPTHHQLRPKEVEMLSNVGLQYLSQYIVECIFQN